MEQLLRQPAWIGRSRYEVTKKKQVFHFGHVKCARSRASKWNIHGGWMEYKSRGHGRSAHKYCTSTPRTSYFEKMIQRPGILEKSFTVAATKDQCQCPNQTIYNLDCVFLMLALPFGYCSVSGAWIPSLCTNFVSLLASLPINSFSIQITLSISASCNQRCLN